MKNKGLKILEVFSMGKLSRTLIKGMVLCTLICIIMTSAFNIFSVSNIVSKNSNEYLKLLTKQKSNTIDVELGRMQGAVDSIHYKISQRFDKEEFKATGTDYIEKLEKEISIFLREEVRDFDNISGIFVKFNPEYVNDYKAGAYYADMLGDGVLRDVEPDDFSQYSKTQDEVEWFYGTIELKQARWLEPYYYDRIDKDIITYVKPICLEDGVLGTVSIDMYFDTISSIVRSVNVYESGQGFLLDQDKRFIVHPEYTLEDSLSTLDGGKYKDMCDSMDEKDNSIIKYEKEGEYKLLGYSKLSNGWYMGISPKLKDVYKERDSMILKLATATIIFAAIITVILSIVIAIFISRKISTPIIGVLGFAESLASGDYSKEMNEDHISRDDEIGLLIKALDRVQKNNKSILLNISDSSDKMLSWCNDVNQSMKQTSLSTEEIAKSIEEIASGSTEQAHDTQNGSEKMTELGEAIVKVQDLIDDVQEDSDSMLNIIDKSSESMSQLSIKSENSENVLEDMSGKIQKTNDSSKQIGDAVTIILSIADQTKLLALNATIEAARAGDHGKGFGVVAEEIRKLSEQSNEHAKQIESVIKELQINVDSVVVTLKDLKKATVENTLGVNDANSNYNNLMGNIHALSQQVDEMSNSSKNMEKNKIEILDIVSKLSLIAHQNASATQQVSATIEEQTAAMEEIVNTTGALLDVAENLQKSVTKFKV